MFGKKKKKDLDLDLDDSEEIDEEADEEEALTNDEGDEKGASEEDIQKNFIFDIEEGCPICRGTVRGNTHYKYFCEKCNVLFDKKDIISEEMGKSYLNKEVAVRKRKLSSDEKAALEKKRKELKERLYDTFSAKKKQELKVEAEAKREEEEESPLEESEPVPVSDKYVEEGSGDGEEVTAPEHPASKVTDINDIIAALGSPVREAEIVSETHEEPEAEEDAESPDEAPDVEPGRIIASTQSKKLHEGGCHFVKKIQADKRVYFNTVEEGMAEGYEPCVCLRRMIAREKSRK